VIFVSAFFGAGDVIGCNRSTFSMPHWKLTLAYDGTPYHGWQVQPGLPTVQGTLASVIHRVTGETVLPQGSGRTDTGVHALGQVASFSLESPIPGSNLQRALNHNLPPSIRVVRVEEVDAGFHARHSARRKTYEYRIAPLAVCSPMLAPYVWNCTWPLDMAAMNEAAGSVVGTHDFLSFAATDPDLETRVGAEFSEDEDGEDGAGEDGAGEKGAGEKDSRVKTAVRTIFASAWHREGELLVYRVTGSGFLHHMVRNLVGTFVDVGRGRTPAREIPEILAAKKRAAAGPTAPPQGLFLLEVEYEG
jgi:tRNA pseudouridine38-40 synthase